MLNEVIADPLTVANELRPVLLRLARELRKETEQMGVTSRQVTLLWLVREHPGLSLRELAAESASKSPDASRQGAYPALPARPRVAAASAGSPRPGRA